MATIFRIVYGATTVDLNGATYTLQSGYAPKQATGTQLTVTESFRLLISGATADARHSAIAALELALHQARQRQRAGSGSRVYLEIQADSASDLYRSELLNGDLDWAEGSIEEDWRITKKITATVAITRRAYWEGPEAELSLTNADGSGTGGRDVVNHDDGGATDDNWVSFTIAGGLPAPLRVQITNTSATTAQRYYLALGATPDVANLTHIVEGETSSSGSQAPGSPDTTLYSGGYYRSASWAGDDEADALVWTLSTAQLDACRGGSFRIVVRFATAPDDTHQARLQLRQSSYVLQQTELITCDGSALLEIGTLRLPPYQLDDNTAYPLSLVLRGKKTGGGTFAVDYVALVPTDGRRDLLPLGAGLEQNATLVDDQISGMVYTTNHATAGRLGDYAGYGELLAQPGRTNRVYIYTTTTAGGAAPVAQAASLRVYYRPRRRSL